VEDGRKMRRVRKEGKDRGTKGREGSIVGDSRRGMGRGDRRRGGGGGEMEGEREGEGQ
jgi:hypothetical protein